MILTKCAACAAPLAHDAPRCVRCLTRYCSSTCQHARTLYEKTAATLDGLLVFFVGVVLFCVAVAVDTFTNLLVAAAPVVMLASFVAVPRLTSNASRRGVGQWGGAGGAICEDHFSVGR